MGESAFSFNSHIRPLFRANDVEAMRYAFDLSSYDDVCVNAQAIWERVEAGSMPCDTMWTAEEVHLFRSWMDGGMPP